MRKQIVARYDRTVPSAGDWLPLEELAEVQVTSEDTAHPIEAALIPGHGSFWRAAAPGQQMIRLLFAQPQAVKRILLKFVEPGVERTQEYVVRWSPDRGLSFRDVVRQQWNFSPSGSTVELEDHRVELDGVTILELHIAPEITRRPAIASLHELRLA
jgi:hypothetical protein